MVDVVEVGLIAALLLFIVLILLAFSVFIIQPYQLGVATVWGSYKGLLNPGFNLRTPLYKVIRVDLRTQVLEVPRQEVITKDNSPTNVDAIIYIKVVDPKNSIFQVQDYHVATVALAQTTLRSVIGDMELDEVLYNRERINTRLRDILDESTDRWGVRVEAVEIKEVDPVGPVKAAMEEQTSAERQRRAAVLRADGEKRSAILVSEGQKRSRILQAEGLRQSKILEAEGSRMATILEAQGESQRLRILALGAGTLDAKALTVLSLDTVSDLGNGQATKILFPFEFSRLMEGASEYLGTSRTVPDRVLNTMDELENRIGKMDDILGPIPKQDELMTEIKSIEDEIKAETDESTAMVGGSIDDSAPDAVTPTPPRLAPPRTMDIGSSTHAADPTPPPPAASPPPPTGVPDPKKRSPASP